MRKRPREEGVGAATGSCVGSARSPDPTPFPAQVVLNNNDDEDDDDDNADEDDDADDDGDDRGQELFGTAHTRQLV